MKHTAAFIIGLFLFSIPSYGYLISPSTEVSSEEFYTQCLDLNRDREDDAERLCHNLASQVELQQNR